jgi:hypothetical protein
MPVSMMYRREISHETHAKFASIALREDELPVQLDMCNYYAYESAYYHHTTRTYVVGTHLVFRNDFM